MTLLPAPQAAPVMPRTNADAPYSLKGKKFLGRRLSVMVVFATECKPCVESIPFYKRLTELPVLDGKERKLIIFSQGGVWPVRDIIQAHPQKFEHNTISFPTTRRFDIKGVPTVLLINAAGDRIGEWPGKLSPAQEQRVIAAITAAAKR
ncbi:MAG: thioredoxin family protein [Acidobacteriota bacterium]|nr:thioredoxin family protein [Acidobacteriota bacterium]